MNNAANIKILIECYNDISYLANHLPIREARKFEELKPLMIERIEKEVKSHE